MKCMAFRTSFEQFYRELEMACSDAWYDALFQVLEEVKRALQQGKYIPPPTGY